MWYLIPLLLVGIRRFPGLSVLQVVEGDAMRSALLDHGGLQFLFVYFALGFLGGWLVGFVGGFVSWFVCSFVCGNIIVDF